MKIIFICTKSITFNTFLKSQADYFTKKGFKVEIACSDIENLNLKFKKHRINFPKKILDLFNVIIYFKVYKDIKNLIDKNRSSIYYLHTPVASHFFRLFTFFDKLKLIYFVHGFRFTSKTNPIKSLFFKIIEKILSFNSSVFITINKEDYQYAKFKLLKSISVHKIKGVGLNLTTKHFKQKIKKKENIKKILVIAAFKKEKGYLDILKVAELIKNQKMKIECYGYGNYHYFNSIKISRNLTNISFKKFDKNLNKKIKNFDLLLHLSKREGLPVSVMQCLSEGLPVICYNIRGNNDLIIDRLNGYFVNSYKEASKKIIYLNLNKKIYNKMRYCGFKSINKDYFKNQINFNLYKIIKNYSKYN